MARLLAPTGDYRTAPNAIRLTWLAQLASQLTGIHDEMGIHGDVRPARVQLLPLAAGETFPSVALRRPSPVANPPPDVAQVLYMHPGLLDGSIKTLTRDTDVYALGVLAWHILSGTPPFAAAFPDGLAAYDKPTAVSLLSAYLARVPDGQALPASPMLWHAEEVTDLHRVWSARDRGSVTARSLAASLTWLAAQADGAGGRCSAGWAPGRAMPLVVSVHDTAMARVRSSVVAVEAGDTFSVVKHEVERATGYLVGEQRLSLPTGTALSDDATVGDAGLHHAAAVTATVGGKYGITVAVRRQVGMAEEVIALEVAGGDMLDAAVLRPIAARYGAGACARLSAYHDRQSVVLRDPTTTTVRQHAILPGSRIVVLGPAARDRVVFSVRTGEGKDLLFNASLSTTVEAVARKCVSSLGLPPGAIVYLMLEGERLVSYCTVGASGIRDGSSINLIPELLGD